MTKTLDELIKDMEEAEARAVKANRRAYWACMIAVWVNLFNLGLQTGLLIGRHGAH